MGKTVAVQQVVGTSASKTIIENIGAKRISGSDLVADGKFPFWVFYIEEIANMAVWYGTEIEADSEVWMGGLGYAVAGNTAVRDTLIAQEGQKYFNIETDQAETYSNGQWGEGGGEPGAALPDYTFLDPGATIIAGSNHVLVASGDYLVPNTEDTDQIFTTGISSTIAVNHGIRAYLIAYTDHTFRVTDGEEVDRLELMAGYVYELVLASDYIFDVYYIKLDNIVGSIYGVARAALTTGLVDSTEVLTVGVNSPTEIAISTSPEVFYISLIPSNPLDSAVITQKWPAATYDVSSIVLPSDGLHVRWLAYGDGGNLYVEETNPINEDWLFPFCRVLLKRSAGVVSLASEDAFSLTLRPAFANYTKELRSRAPLSISAGLVPNNNLTIQTTGGYIRGESVNYSQDHTNPHDYVIVPTNPMPFMPVKGNTAEIPSLPVPITSLDPSQYWDGNFIQLVGNNNYSVQRIAITSKATWLVQMGEATYTSLDAAIAAIDFAPFTEQFPLEEFVEVARVAMRGNTSDLTDSSRVFWKLSGSGTSSGANTGVEEAPINGLPHVRKDAAWTPLGDVVREGDNVSTLTNDAGYLTEAPALVYATDTTIGGLRYTLVDGTLNLIFEATLQYSNLGEDFGGNPMGISTNSLGDIVYGVGFITNALYLASDGGVTFVDTLSQVGSWGFATASNSVGDIVYALDNSSGNVYYSNNQGSLLVNRGVLAGASPMEIACNGVGSTVYVINNSTNELYRSANSAVSFSNLGALFDTNTVSVDCDSTGTIVHVLDASTNTLYSSTNSGTSFTSQVITSPWALYSLTCSDDGSIIYISSNATAATVVYKIADGVVSELPTPEEITIAKIACNGDGSILYLTSNTSDVVLKGEFS